MKSMYPSSYNSSPYQQGQQGRESAAVKEPVDLNKVLHQSLTAIHAAIDKNKVIIRCDQLPVTKGVSSDFDKLFNSIMQFILSQDPVGSKQFLYIKCEEEQLGKEVLVAGDQDKMYVLQFHSNIELDEYWETAYKPALLDCEQIAKSYSGTFTYTHLHSGSLFTLRVPAKPL